MRQFLVLMNMSSLAVQKDLNIRSLGHFYGLCCWEEEYSLSFNKHLCKWMKLTKTLCELVCGSGGVKSPPSPPLLPRCRLRRPPLTLIISDKCIISQVFTLISSLHPILSFLSPCLSSYLVPLQLPVLSSSLLLSPHYLLSVLLSPPFSVFVVSLPPPSCLAICQPFPVSALKWPAGSSHSLINTNTEQHKKHISFFLASNLLFLACPYNNVRARCKRFTAVME